VVLGELPTLAATLPLLRELRPGDARGQVDVDPEVPVLVLSPAGGELCELRAFEAGADDYQPASTSCLVPIFLRSRTKRWGRALSARPRKGRRTR
jgi:PleD family two-component response regulator